jgi:amidophosphoribosyltransferase
MNNSLPFLLSKPISEKCGVVLLWDGKKEAPLLARKALSALQHRGQESAGITVYKNKKGLITYKSMGLISNVLTDAIVRKCGKAYTAIAQNRYSTTGESTTINCQPVVQKFKSYAISIGHNGNIPDLGYLNTHVIKKTKATSDTALIAALLIQNRSKYPTWLETIRQTLPMISGAYCLVMLTEDGYAYAARDPFGIRPLCLGRTESGWVIASESVSLDAINANYMRDVCRGEIIYINPKGELASSFFGEPKTQKSCLFEHVYFSRPDSFVNGKRIKDGREALGRKLAKRIRSKGIKPDVIVPIFHSGYYAAKSAAFELGLPLVEAVITNSYYGRTFIHPSHNSRLKAVNGKHNFIPDEISGKKVLFVDDSAVRSTTSRALTQGLLNAGAKEVYAGFSSPPIVNPCDLGIDMKSKDELVAAPWKGKPLHVIERNVAQKIGAHDVTYLSLEDTIEAIGGQYNEYYSYYFNGIHPIRCKKEYFPRIKKKLNSKQQLVVFISGSGTNLQNIIDEISVKRLNAEIVSVISNKSEAYGIQRAIKYKIPYRIIDSKGIFKDKNKRRLYEVQLTQLINECKPDLIVLAGWMLVLGDKFLNNIQEMQIPIINLHPALLTNTNEDFTTTSRGKLPVIRGAHAIKEAYDRNLPLSGVTIHQVLPGNSYDTGPIILREEVRRIEDETFDEWEAKIHESEYRVLLSAIKRVIHVLGQGIDTSRGGFPW